MLDRTFLGAALGLALLAPGAAFADTLRVPGDFDTIQDAVDAAVGGDVIEIRGRHDEAVVVSGKQNLTFRGRGGATIRSGNDDVGMHVGECIDITITGIRLEGGLRGIRAEYCIGLLIEKCSTRRTGDAGFDARFCTDVSIVRCRVDDSGDEGITFGDRDGNEPVTGGLIEKCSVRNCDTDGYRVIGTDIDVVKCTSDRTDSNGFQIGHDVMDLTARVRVEKCKVKRAGNEGFAVYGDDVTLVRCLVVVAVEEGFDVEAVGTVLDRCKAVKCRRGIEFENADDCRAVQCKLTKNDENGVFLRATTGTRVEDCKATRSGTDGFRIDADSDGNTLTGNKAAGSRDFDLRDESEPGSNTIENNKFKTTTTDPLP